MSGERTRSNQPAQTGFGWKDEEPDLTSDEHDLMTAFMEQAWRDLGIDMSTVPKARHDELLAAKITAYEWVTSDEMYLMSFRSVLMHLNVEAFERVREVMLRGFVMPSEDVPEYMRAEYASTRRDDRIYTKHPKQIEMQEVIDAEVVEMVPEPKPMPLLPPASTTAATDESDRYSFSRLLEEIKLSEPTKPDATGESGAANWLRAGREDDAKDD